MTTQCQLRLALRRNPYPADTGRFAPNVLDHASQSRACETIVSKLGIDATRKLPGEGFKRPRPPLIKMDEAVKTKVEKLLQVSR